MRKPYIKCPHCGKMIRYLRLHIRNNHPEQLLNDKREVKRLLRLKNAQIKEGVIIIENTENVQPKT